MLLGNPSVRGLSCRDDGVEKKSTPPDVDVGTPAASRRGDDDIGDDTGGTGTPAASRIDGLGWLVGLVNPLDERSVPPPIAAIASANASPPRFVVVDSVIVSPPNEKDGLANTKSVGFGGCCGGIIGGKLLPAASILSREPGVRRGAPVEPSSRHPKTAIAEMIGHSTSKLMHKLSAHAPSARGAPVK